MRRLFALGIAVLATIVLCARNSNSALAFWWAVIHGGGPVALIVLLPIAIPLALVWVAFWYVNRSSRRSALAVFAGVAAAILLLTEVPFPGTRADRTRRERALQAIEVRNVQDDLLLSAKGHPIGVRVTYEVVAPRRVVAWAYLFLTSPNTELSLTDQPGRVTALFDSMEFWGPAEMVIPLPDSVQGIYRVFESGRRYTLTARRMPGFLIYDEETRQPCLRIRPSSVSEADIVSAIARRGPTKYGIRIAFSSDGGMGPDHHVSFMTSREYDLDAMYRTILKEGNQRCNF